MRLKSEKCFYHVVFWVIFQKAKKKMGGGNSRQQTWAPQDMQQNPEKIERLTHLLALKSEHDQTVATRGWDRSQQEMVLLVIIKLL